MLRNTVNAVRTVRNAHVSMLPGISGTYAYSLFQVSLKENVLPQTVAQLDSISKLVSTNPSVASALNDPSLSLTDRKSLVDSFKPTHNNNVFLANFFTALAENNRLSYIPQINTDLMKLNDQYKGVVSVTLTTAKPLADHNSSSNKIGERLSTSIKKSSLLANDQSIKMNYKVDPELLGGMVLEIGDKTIDLSVKSKIQELNNSLKSDL
ncbi:ATP synthase subunit 5, mitochondrial [Monosporozyma servazzii]